MGIYAFLDIFFMIFHSIIILFNLFGWIWVKTRLANLITLLLTGLSWTILGIFYGLGFCPLTQWHFNVLAKLGADTYHTSYISYFIERLFSFTFPGAKVDLYTLLFYLVALSISLIMNRKKMSGMFGK